MSDDFEYNVSRFFPPAAFSSDSVHRDSSIGMQGRSESPIRSNNHPDMVTKALVEKSQFSSASACNMITVESDDWDFHQQSRYQHKDLLALVFIYEPCSLADRCPRAMRRNK